MASIHRDSKGRSPYFYCAFTLPNGQRVLRSTKQKIRAKALEMCLKLERASKKARRGDFGEAQARKVLNDILEVTGQPAMNLQTVQQFVKAWLVGKERAKAPGTAQRYSDALKPFLDSLGKRASVNLSNLAVADVNAFVAGCHRDCLSNKTVNFRIKTIRAVLNSACRQRLIEVNVAEEVPTLADDSAEKGTFEPEELQALLRAADPGSEGTEWKGVILVGLTAALRIGDAATLRWEDIDETSDAKVIRFIPQKRSRTAAAKSLEVPILPDLAEYLLNQQKKHVRASGPIFPTLARKSVQGNAGLSNTFSRLIKQAGVSNPAITKAKGGKSRSVYRLSFHSLRHTYVKLLVRMNVSKEIRMKLVGHTSDAHDRYSHIERKTLAEALKEFPRVLDGNIVVRLP